MADQFNAFSLDPLQLEQDQIAQQMRLAEAQALRRGTGRGPSQFDIGNDMVVDLAANMAQGVDMPRLRDRQQNLSAQFQQSFDEATVGAPDQIRALIKNPATRPQGMQLLLEYNQDQMDKINGNDPSRFITQGGVNNALPGTTQAIGGGGPGPSAGQYDMQAILKGMASRNPRTKAMAEAAYKEASRQVDPDKLGVNPDGSSAPFDANQNAAQQQKARLAAATQAVNAGPTEMKLPGGAVGYVPKTDPSFPTNQVLGLPGQSQSQIQGGQALPGAVAAQPPQGAAPQQQALPQSAPAPQSQPDMVPVPNGPGGSRGTFPVPRPVAEKMLRNGIQINLDQIPPQQLPALYQEIMAQPDKGQQPQGQQPQVPVQQAQTAATAANAPIDVSLRPKGDVSKGYESYIDPNMKITLPQSQYANPMQEKMYQDRVNENHAQLSKLDAKFTPGELSRLVDEAGDIIHNKPHLSGKAAAAWQGITTLPPHVDEATANTIKLNAIAQTLAGIKTRQVQNTQISDFDFKVGQMQVPSTEMPLEGQMKVWDSLKQESDYLEGMSAAVRKGVYNNIPANEAARAFSTWHRDALKHNEDLKNPTSAPAGSSPAAGRSQAAPFEYKEPGTFGRIGGFLSDKTAYGDMIKSIPATVAGVATNPGAWGDALADKARGLSNFAGFGDREVSVKRAQEHEARAAQDPQGYGAGYNFAGSVPETLAFTAAGPEMAALKGVRGALDLARVAAPSVARTAAVGGVSGASHTEESWGQQAKNATFGAAAGLAGSLLPAALPATRIAARAGGRATEELLSEFPRFRSTLSRSQINPHAGNAAVGGGVPSVRAAEQVRAMSDDLATKAGLKPGPLDFEVITSTKNTTNKGVEDILTNGSPTKVDSMDKQLYRTAVTSNPEIDQVMSKSPVLKFVQETLTSNSGATFKPGAAVSIWKEVQKLGNSEAEQAVKQIVEGMVTRNMPGDVAKQFKTLNGQLGMLKEVEAAYSAGTGKLEGSRYLTPDGITRVGKENPGGSMDKARHMLAQMDVGDVKPRVTPDLDVTNLKTLPRWAQFAVSPTVNRFDSNALGASRSTKAILNSLRGITQAGQPALAQEFYNAEK
jgi:hypothetical protein